MEPNAAKSNTRLRSPLKQNQGVFLRFFFFTPNRRLPSRLNTRRLDWLLTEQIKNSVEEELITLNRAIVLCLREVNIHLLGVVLQITRFRKPLCVGRTTQYINYNTYLSLWHKIILISPNPTFDNPLRLINSQPCVVQHIAKVGGVPGYRELGGVGGGDPAACPVTGRPNPWGHLRQGQMITYALQIPGEHTQITPPTMPHHLLQQRVLLYF